MTETEYLLRERENIMEFDGGLDRYEAQIKAAEDQNKQPYLFSEMK